jgi:CubicO group peptidase (beta-lactamase class C family)
VDLSDGTGVVPFTSVVTAAGAAGSIASTSLDVARWARALYGGDVLDPASLASMIDDAIGVAYWRPTMPYGLGVQELTIAGWGTYGHSGRLLGFRGAMRYLPDTGVAIAVLTNQSSVDPAPLVGTLLDAAFPAPLPCRTCR